VPDSLVLQGGVLVAPERLVLQSGAPVDDLAIHIQRLCQRPWGLMTHPHFSMLLCVCVVSILNQPLPNPNPMPKALDGSIAKLTEWVMPKALGTNDTPTLVYVIVVVCVCGFYSKPNPT
jgi:hypothetical protein